MPRPPDETSTPKTWALKTPHEWDGPAHDVDELQATRAGFDAMFNVTLFGKDPKERNLARARAASLIADTFYDLAAQGQDTTFGHLIEGGWDWGEVSEYTKCVLAMLGRRY